MVGNEANNDLRNPGSFHKYMDAKNMMLASTLAMHLKREGIYHKKNTSLCVLK